MATTQRFDMKYSEACEFLEIKPSSIYQLIGDGKLHSHAVPGSREKLLDRYEVIRYKHRKHPEKAEQIIALLEVGQAVPPSEVSPVPQEAQQGDLGNTRSLVSYLPFLTFVREIFLGKSKQEEETNIKLIQSISETRASHNAAIQAILQPIAEKVSLNPGDTGQLILMAAQQLAESDPDLSQEVVTEESLNRLTNIVPGFFQEAEREEIATFLRDKAKEKRLYVREGTRELAPTG